MAMPSLGYVRPVVKAEAQGSPKIELALSLTDPTPTVRKEVVLDKAFVLHDIFSAEQCRLLCEAAEEMQYSFWNPLAPNKDYRNVDTVELTHPALAAYIWSRVRDFCPEHEELTEEQADRGSDGFWHSTEINPNLLFARYTNGGHFSPHTDGWTILDFNRRSLYSVVVYLNSCAEGGATRLFSSCDSFVKDEQGRYR
eukprot:RCo055446